MLKADKKVRDYLERADKILMENEDVPNKPSHIIEIAKMIQREEHA